MSLKLGLASNMQDEVNNIEEIWNLYKNVVDQWLVVDSGSTDGTQDKLREVVGDKLILVESDMIKSAGYGYSRTKLIELSEGMDWVHIVDGDERMFPEDAKKVRDLVTLVHDKYDLIRLPRCHYQDWEMTKVEYGSMDKIGSDWRRALKINPDWQPRLIKRTITDGVSKVQFFRRVHELIKGVDNELRSLDSPVIRHFGWMKTDEKQKQVSDLCNDLWKKDCENEEIADTFKMEIERGYAVRGPEVKKRVEKERDKNDK